jgi:IMP dehydrogenase
MNEAVLGADGREPSVREYMTSDVETVAPGDTAATVAERIADSGHDGFPVCTDRRVEGFVSATDLLLAADDDPVSAVMSRDLVVADPDMSVTDAARVILRSGIRKLPVVDAEGDLVGIISNADVVRSQIERATPEKVGRLSRTLESLHGVETTQDRRTVELSALTPTQSKVYADELEGRMYELERGLAEPLVVIDAPDALLLADGHHRVLAADRLGITGMDAYVIVIDDPVDLGMANTAVSQGLTSIDDIDVVDYARHPLVETVERLQ